jgi:hypothetical protein
MLLGKLDLEEEIFTGVYSRYREIGTRYISSSPGTNDTGWTQGNGSVGAWGR